MSDGLGGPQLHCTCGSGNGVKSSRAGSSSAVREQTSNLLPTFPEQRELSESCVKATRAGNSPGS